MKHLDIVHSFQDRQTNASRGLCRVRSFATISGTVVLLTDLGDKNDGQSVTNAVESVVGSLLELGIVIAPATFIEHYEGNVFRGDTFDLVTLSPTSWKSLSRDEALRLIGGEASELDDRSDSNPRIVEQADRLRFRRNPFVDSPSPESNDVIKRKLQIIDGMISKRAVEDLVHAGAGEQQLQRLLKTDLSIFGEAYAKPDDEYICFSEFPLADGAVDFVVLTGRSRMDVILVEVKGANFNLFNSNHYGAFNHKVIEAATQIQKRLGEIFRDLESFRQHVHQLRHRAEIGEAIHNAFVGPYHRLQVDPKKDINVRSVVIGGRTVNDVEESTKRQDYEARSTPPVRIESWNTWLRRLQRA
ncbi:Shedu immune nuclease family protein [Pelomonas sp. KK5]|uniref:Shedu immune nuclease family protein n=1 Tax=Pelomonas sp. KK5 TaxID=1855730 RepID=UPI00097C0C29|nr:Shedu immune nuclease family protein [Pelomonas sp. KK5]